MKEDILDFIRIAALSISLLVTAGISIAIIVGIPTAAIIWIIEAFQK